MTKIVLFDFRANILRFGSIQRTISPELFCYEVVQHGVACKDTVFNKSRVTTNVDELRSVRILMGVINDLTTKVRSYL